jgi:sugar phosphate isomerase/epimerase
VKSAVTICLVPEARKGPFVFHDGLEQGCEAAAALGFDAVEIFPSGADELLAARPAAVAASHGLAIAAVGTGAGYVKHGLHLVHHDATVRQTAREFIRALIDSAADLGAPAIIGSMQGRSSPEVPRDAALDHLAAALTELGSQAAARGQVLLYEPLNRYETDLFSRQEEAAAFLDARGIAGVKLLCDLFHMNIEEADLAGTLRTCGRHVGHVHWADSNRRAIGLGHTDAAPVVAALESIGYTGYLSAEVLPLPSPEAAARHSIESFCRHVRT